jgi:uncharacterized iron-regulated membrane protein
MASIDPTAVGKTPADAPRVNRFYFAAWRWHFYAGIFVAPFMIMLALTGLIMVWVSSTTELNGERTSVPISGEWQAVSVLADAAVAAVPGGVVTQYVEPRAPGKVALFSVMDGETQMAVLVDPYMATVVDQFVWGDNWYTFASEIHGTLLLGETGDHLIEIAAGFGILLIATGVYMWWPRNGAGLGRVLIPDLTARGRALWKSLHQSIGFWVSALLLFFLISGMSWTSIWGDRFVQAWNTFPAEKWGAPLSDMTHEEMNAHGEHEVPWPLENAPMPTSGSLAGTAGVTGPVTIDNVVDFARSLRFAGRFQLNLPADETGVWTISHDTMSNDGGFATGDRTLHLDQYTGKVLADVRYADYSPYAKMMAWGIALHEGDMGNWNLVLNTLFCLSVVFIAVSGLVMWWKRRPAGAFRLAAPPLPADLPLWKGAVLVGLFVALAFPLVGITLVVVIAIDLLVLSWMPAVKRIVS